MTFGFDDDDGAVVASSSSLSSPKGLVGFLGVKEVSAVLLREVRELDSIISTAGGLVGSVSGEEEELSVGSTGISSSITVFSIGDDVGGRTTRSEDEASYGGGGCSSSFPSTELASASAASFAFGSYSGFLTV